LQARGTRAAGVGMQFHHFFTLLSQ